MKTILAALFTILLLFPASALGEIQIIMHAVKQPFGGSQSPDDARIAAVAKAKREALELAGTYVESTTVVKNAQVEKDEILALTAGVLKAEVVSQKNYTTDDAFGIEVAVRVEVDTAVLEARLKKALEDRTFFEQLKQARARERELLKKITALEVENRKGGKSDQKAANLKKEFQQASQGLTAVEWFYKAAALWEGDKYTNSKKAIEYLSNAIKLQPDYADAFYNWGLTYAKLGQYQRAIEGFNEAIRLKPDDSSAHINRGATYYELGQYQRAIEDFNKAIRLKPDYALAYSNRGLAYNKIGQHQRAIADYNEAIRLKPDNADALSYRGLAYTKLGQHQRAIEDYNQSIHLKPDYAYAYYSRGLTYGLLKQDQRALDDFNEAIRLKPDDADAYHSRGLSYCLLKQYQRAIKDFNEAIRLKPDNADALSYRGLAYEDLEQHQRAIDDFNEAIRMNPYLAWAYSYRGLAYIRSGNSREGCRSLIRACELGDCKAYDLSKQKGDCL